MTAHDGCCSRTCLSCCSCSVERRCATWSMNSTALGSPGLIELWTPELSEFRRGDFAFCCSLREKTILVLCSLVQMQEKFRRSFRDRNCVDSIGQKDPAAWDGRSMRYQL